MIITLAIMMTAMTMLPQINGSLVSYAENDDITVTDPADNTDGTGQTDGDEVQPEADVTDDGEEADKPDAESGDDDVDKPDEGAQPENKEDTKEPAAAPKAAPKAAPSLRATQFPFTVKVGNTTTQCATWKDAIDTANVNTGAVVITMTDDYTFTTADQDYPFTADKAFTLNGDGHTLTRGEGVTGDLISIKSATKALTINNLTIDGNESVSATGNIILRYGSNNMSATTLSNVTINAGNTTGNAVSIENSRTGRTAPVSMTSCTIDMQDSTGSAFYTTLNSEDTFTNVEITGSGKAGAATLVQFGTNNITLTGVSVTGHASSAGTCAVDAATASNVYISGATNIIGNTAAGSPANLSIPSNAGHTHFTSTITKDIGITTTNNHLGDRFARWENDETYGWSHLKNDSMQDGTYVTYRDGSGNTTYIVWKDTSGDYTAQDVENMFGNPEINYPLKTAPNEEDMELVPEGAVAGINNDDITNPYMVWKSVEYNDDNSADITLNYFQRQVNLKLDLIFVIDETGTMGDRVTANGYTQSQAWWARYASVRAAKGALDLNGTYENYNVNNRAKIISWSTGKRVESDFLNDYDELLSFIGSYPAIAGGTNPSYAVTYAREAVAESRAEGRVPIVIWMSDMHVMNNTTMSNAPLLRQEAEAVYAIMVFEEHPNAYKAGMKLLTPEAYHYFSDNSDASKLITPISTVIKNAIDHCDTGMHIEDELGAATASGADLNGITSSDEVATTADALYDSSTDTVDWDLLTDDRTILEDENNTDDLRLKTGKMYKKVIHIPLDEGIYSGSATSNQQLRVMNDDEVLNTIEPVDSPLLKKPLEIIVKSADSPNPVVKPTEFTLSRGQHTWNLVSDSSGKLTVPWTENDSAEGANFPAGSTYTLTQVSTGEDNVLPGGTWTLNVDSNTYEITATPVQSSETNVNRTLATGVSAGKLVIYNDSEPTVTFNANGGTFGSSATKADTVDFSTTETSHTYTIPDDIVPTNSNPLLSFDGWNTAADGSGTAYNAGDTIKVWRGANSSFITLYAQWVECKKLTVTNENLGDYANADDAFTVVLTIEPGSGMDPLTSTSDERLTRITGLSGTESWTVSDGKATLEFTIDGTTAGHERVFDKIPAGWSYKVKENASMGYTVEYSSDGSSYAESDTGISGAFTADATVYLRNTRSNVVPSGITMRKRFEFLMLVVAAMLAAALVKVLQLRKRYSAK